MSWNVQNSSIEMTEHDFGIALTFKFSGFKVEAGDSIIFTLKKEADGESILTKTFDNVVDNTIELLLTEEDTALLNPGDYVYTLDWYKQNVFMYNIFEDASFKVVNKA